MLIKHTLLIVSSLVIANSLLIQKHVDAASLNVDNKFATVYNPYGIGELVRYYGLTELSASEESIRTFANERDELFTVAMNRLKK